MFTTDGAVTPDAPPATDDGDDDDDFEEELQAAAARARVTPRASRARVERMGTEVLLVDGREGVNAGPIRR
jgi:hypothetical protein